MGCAWGYDLDCRISEYTAPDGRSREDHCVRLEDLIFDVVNPDGMSQVTGGSRPLDDIRNAITACWVKTASHKSGALVKGKFIGTRTEEEAEFLDDIVLWIVHSQVKVGDGLFTRYVTLRDGTLSRKSLIGRMVREELKEAATLEGLDPDYFSSHSLRKGATTHLRSQGASEADIRDRGNYASGSEVARLTYDYSTAGHGPFSSNSLAGGRKPDVSDIRRHLPGSLGFK